MTKQELINYLRLSVDVADKDSDAKDSLYLKLSDDDILLYLEIAKSREYSDEDLDDFPPESIYPLMLLAKKELYLSLAVKHASLYDLMADDNNQLKRSQWFDHYMKLVVNMDDAWVQFVDEGGTGGYTLTSANVTIPTRYYTRYNYENEPLPYIKAKIDGVGLDKIEVSWKSTCNHFFNSSVYVSTSPVSDYHADETISDSAKLVTIITDPHIKRCRINGCQPDTTYYVTVVVMDRTGRSMYHEVSATTLSLEPEEPVENDTVEASL